MEETALIRQEVEVSLLLRGNPNWQVFRVCVSVAPELLVSGLPRWGAIVMQALEEEPYYWETVSGWHVSVDVDEVQMVMARPIFGESAGE